METLCVTADKSGDLTIYGALVELVDTRDFNKIECLGEKSPCRIFQIRWKPFR
jgi:hypothetical protein